MSLHAVITQRGRRVRSLGVLTTTLGAILAFWLVMTQAVFAQVVPPPSDATVLSATTVEDTAVTIDTTNIQADPRYAVVVSTAPAHGTVVQGPAVFPSNFNIIYTPGANQAGTVTFSYQICTLPPDSPTRCGQSAQVTVTITAVDDGPQAGPDNATVLFGQSVLIDVRANDNGGPNEAADAATLVSVSSPSPNGAAVIENGQIRYTAPSAANPCVSGNATFIYTIRDNANQQTTGLVTVARSCPAQQNTMLKLSNPYNFTNHTFKVDVTLESVNTNVAAVDFFVNYQASCVTDPDVPTDSKLSDDVTSGLVALGFVFDAQDQPYATSGAGALHFIAAKALGNEFLAGPSNPTRLLATMTFKAVPGCVTTNSDLTFTNAIFTDVNGATITTNVDVENKTDVPLDSANNKPTSLTLSNQTIAGNAPTNAYIGMFVTTDPDVNDVIVYTLIPPSSPNFKVGVNPYDNDELSLNGAVPVGGLYQVTVKASDPYNAFITKTFEIMVTAFNKAAPDADDDGTYAVNGRTEIPFRSNPAQPFDLATGDSDTTDGDPTCAKCSIQAVTNGSKGVVSNLGSKVVYIPTDPKFTGTDVFTYTLTDNDLTGALTDKGRVTVNVINTVAAGNCNANASIEAGDLTATGLEIFDGDGNLWYDIYQGSYQNFSPYGCNSNQDTVLDAGDISCTAKKIFTPAFVCGVTLVAANADMATLAVGTVNAAPGATVQLPVRLQTAGYSVAAAAFAIDINRDELSFDDTDADGDGVADAVSLNVPGGLLTSAVYNADESRIEIVVTGLIPPFPTLADGALATVRLTVKEGVDAGESTVALTNSSLGSDEGQSVPLEVTAGAIQITQTVSQPANRVLLPLINR